MALTIPLLCEESGPVLAAGVHCAQIREKWLEQRVREEMGREQALPFSREFSFFSDRARSRKVNFCAKIIVLEERGR